jgi:hypothetical protein
MSEKTIKQEELLKKIHLWVAVLAALTTFIVGAYNVKNIFFTKKQPEPVRVERNSSNALREAAEEVGASWLKELAAKNRNN